jgi:hypothetical protein
MMRYIPLIILLYSNSLIGQTVFVSLDTECPMSQKYVRVLEQLATDFPKIHFEGVFTKWETDSTLLEFRENYHFSWTARIDSSNQWLQAMHVQVVPECLFFDEKQQLLYRGSIDNWFYALGKYRPKATEHYLRDALNAYAKGECINVEKTDALGCIIE